MDDLEALLARSWARAGRALKAAWPPQHRLHASDILRLTADSRFCALATTGPRGRARIVPASFHLSRSGDIWLPTSGEARRLGDLRQTPWAAFAAGQGTGADQWSVTARGPTTLHQMDEVDDLVRSAVVAKLGELSWAGVWVRLRPDSLLAYGVPAAAEGSVSRSPT